ncbi:hypothetical protein [Dietzia sp. 179-F 9C3 NHS]|uniref:hypothetical protein n=1 Tax=Dietzia sp. 179-F 9C3 NHS TaxID=3374295 RepID=UPI0038791580
MTSARTDHLVAAAWGAAEATFFVVVPDVWISRVVLRSPRRGAATTVSALAGALAGGVVTHRWGARIPADSSARALAALPAISPTMVRKVEADLARDGHRTLMEGPTRGVPYKIYARSSGLHGMPLGGFLAWSVPARMARFLLVTAGTAGSMAVGRRLVPRSIDRLAPAAHALAWTGFYLWFFRTVGREESPSQTG